MSFEVLVENLFSVWHHIWLETEGLRVGMAETSEILCPGKAFFFAQKLDVQICT